MSRRRTRYHARWRVDADYRRTLSSRDRAWLKKFEDEYYRAELGPDPLHATSAHREEIYDRQNAGARDLVTATGDDIAQALGRTFERPSLQVRHYQPDDYRMFGRGAEGPGELEAAILDAAAEAVRECRQALEKAKECAAAIRALRIAS